MLGRLVITVPKQESAPHSGKYGQSANTIRENPKPKLINHQNGCARIFWSLGRSLSLRPSINDLVLVPSLRTFQHVVRVLVQGPARVQRLDSLFRVQVATNQHGFHRVFGLGRGRARRSLFPRCSPQRFTSDAAGAVLPLFVALVRKDWHLVMLESARKRRERVTNKKGDDLFTPHVLYWGEAFPRSSFGHCRLTPQRSWPRGGGRCRAFFKVRGLGGFFDDSRHVGSFLSRLHTMVDLLALLDIERHHWGGVS